MQSCGVRRAEQVSLDTADCSARNAWEIGVMCEGRGLAARLQRVMRVHTVHTAGVPPLLLLGMRRQAEEVLDGPASQGRACKSRAGLLWGKDHARSVRAMRSRGVEPTLRRLRRRCHLHRLKQRRRTGTHVDLYIPPVEKESNESAVQPIERSSAVNENPVFVLHALKPACID